MTTKTIYFTKTLRARRAQMLNDFLPAFLLVLSGIDGLTAPNSEHSQMALLNIVVGGGLIVAMIFEWRKNTVHSHTLISRMDIFVGVVLFVEALNRYKSWKGFQPAYLYFLLSVVTILRGLFHSKLPKLRRMTLDDEGFKARVSPFSKLRLQWKEISSLSIGESSIEFQSHQGRTYRLGLRRIQNRDEVAAALQEYAAGKNIQINKPISITGHA
jgi:hypothetical protein